MLYYIKECPDIQNGHPKFKEGLYYEFFVQEDEALSGSISCRRDSCDSRIRNAGTRHSGSGDGSCRGLLKADMQRIYDIYRPMGIQGKHKDGFVVP